MQLILCISGYKLCYEVWSLGDAEERAPCSGLAGSAGEEATLAHPTPQLPSLPHHGDHAQAARQPAKGGPRLCV